MFSDPLCAIFEVVITAKHITEVVTTADDFEHEVRVGRLLRAHRGSETSHGGTYIDPLTNNPRQYDFRWVFCHPDGFAVSLAVECKNINSNSPVVVRGQKRMSIEAFHDLIESRKGGGFQTSRGNIYLDISAIGQVRRVAGDDSMYGMGSFVGRSILRIEASQTRRPSDATITYSRSKDKEIYDRWSQALASAQDLVLDARYYASRFKMPHVFTAIIPVVVVPDAALWSMEYDADDELIHDPIKIDQCEFYVARDMKIPGEFAEFASQTFKFSHIHFVTVKGFEAFLLKVTKDAIWRNRCFNNNMIQAALSERLS